MTAWARKRNAANVDMLVLTGGLFLVFFAIGLFGLLDWQSRRSFLRDATLVTGSLLDVSCSKRQDHCTWRVAYQIDGQTRVFDSAPLSRPGHDRDPIKVAVFMRRPGAEREVRLVESALRGQNVVPMLIGVLGCGATGFALTLAVQAMVVPPKKRKKRRRRLEGSVAGLSDRQANGGL